LNRYSYMQDKDMLGPYWPKGREIVQDKLRAVKPPGAEWEDIQRFEYEPGTKGSRSGQGTFFFSRRLTVGACMEYIRTWSSYHEWEAAHPGMRARSRGGQGDVIDSMFMEMAETDDVMGDMNREIEIEWGSALILARKT